MVLKLKGLSSLK